MAAEALRVLVVEDGCDSSGILSQRLEDAGSVCRRARSIAHARGLLTGETFDLVLSSMRLPDGSARLLIPLLIDSEASLFCAQAMNDGCWWLPAVYRGRNCWGMANPMRSEEFAFLLEELAQQKIRDIALLMAERPADAAAPLPAIAGKSAGVWQQKDAAFKTP
ncbi:MAG: hypothetical protein ACRD5F_11685 [Candidatus Acidiferrales bacterium]